MSKRHSRVALHISACVFAILQTVLANCTLSNDLVHEFDNREGGPELAKFVAEFSVGVSTTNTTRAAGFMSSRYLKGLILRALQNSTHDPDRDRGPSPSPWLLQSLRPESTILTAYLVPPGLTLKLWQSAAECGDFIVRNSYVEHEVILKAAGSMKTQMRAGLAAPAPGPAPDIRILQLNQAHELELRKLNDKRLENELRQNLTLLELKMHLEWKQSVLSQHNKDLAQMTEMNKMAMDFFKRLADPTHVIKYNNHTHNLAVESSELGHRQKMEERYEEMAAEMRRLMIAVAESSHDEIGDNFGEQTLLWRVGLFVLAGLVVAAVGIGALCYFRHKRRHQPKNRIGGPSLHPFSKFFAPAIIVPRAKLMPTTTTNTHQMQTDARQSRSLLK